MSVLYVVLMLALAVIQVLMVIKFFQIAADARATRHYVSGIFPKKKIALEVERRIYLGQIKEAEDILLNEKFLCEKKIKSLSGDKKKDMERYVSSLDAKLKRLRSEVD